MPDLTHLYQIWDTADQVAEEQGLFFFVWVAKRLTVHWQNHYILDTIILILGFVVVALFIWWFCGYKIWRRKRIQAKHRRFLKKEVKKKARQG